MPMTKFCLQDNRGKLDDNKTYDQINERGYKIERAIHGVSPPSNVEPSPEHVDSRAGKYAGELGRKYSEIFRD